MSRKKKKRHSGNFSRIVALLIIIAAIIGGVGYYIFSSDPFIQMSYGAVNLLKQGSTTYNIESNMKFELSGIEIIGTYSDEKKSNKSGKFKYNSDEQNLEISGINKSDDSQNEYKIELNGTEYKIGSNSDGEWKYNTGDEDNLRNLLKNLNKFEKINIPELIIYRLSDNYKKHVSNKYNFVMTDKNGEKTINVGIQPKSVLNFVKKNPSIVLAMIGNNNADEFIKNIDDYVSDDDIKSCSAVFEIDKNCNIKSISFEINFLPDIAKYLESNIGEGIFGDFSGFITDGIKCNIDYSAKIEFK